MSQATEPDTPNDAAPFLCFSGQDWWYHNRAHSDFQLMTRIARRRKVLLINSIGMRLPLPGRSKRFARRILRKVRSVTKMLRQPVPELPNYHVLTPFILPFYGVNALRSLNYRMVSAQVRLAMTRVGIRQPVVFLTLPTAWPVAKGLTQRALLYNRSDKHSEFTEVDNAYINTLELELMREADRTLYVSRQLMSDERELTGSAAHFLDHGVDLQHFSARGDEPADLAAIPRPRIGFFGGFDDYVIDFDLLADVAKAFPRAQVVLIGDATCSMQQLTSLANVHWLGFKPYQEIPGYGSGFDVALMPWLDNEWIRNCNPIKLKEYLALGMNVVTTHFPEIEHYAEYVRVGHDSREFVALVGQALEAGPPTSRENMRQAMARHSWDHRADELLALSDSLFTAPCVAS